LSKERWWRRGLGLGLGPNGWGSWQSAKR